ncbi:MAG: hypothetical protein U0798_12120 [Gemmataceae bacterium]
MRKTLILERKCRARLTRGEFSLLERGAAKLLTTAMFTTISSATRTD